MKKIVTILMAFFMAVSLVSCVPANNKTSNDGRSSKLKTIALKLPDKELNLMEYQTFFYMMYNNTLQNAGGATKLGIDESKSLKDQTCSYQGYTDKTWAQFFIKQTVDYAQTVYSVISDAKKNGYEFTEADQAEVDAQMKAFKDSMAKAVTDVKITESEYLAKSCGKDSTLDDFEAYLKDLILYKRYTKETMLSLTYSPEQVNEYYQSNKLDVDVYNFRILPFPYLTEGSSTTEGDTKEAAKEKAEKFIKESTDEDTWLANVVKYADQKLLAQYAAQDFTLTKNMNIKRAFASDENTLSWFSDENRKEFDEIIVDKQAAFLVIAYISKNNLDYNTIDVRHILIKDKSDAGETKAEQVLSEWKNGDATENSFVDLVATYSEDTGSSKVGGLYQGVQQDQMVQPFNDWCFDAARKPGDTGIVKTDFGFHVMYFAKTGENQRVKTITALLQNQDYSKYLDSLTKDQKLDIDETLLMSILDESTSLPTDEVSKGK